MAATNDDRQQSGMRKTEATVGQPDAASELNALDRLRGRLEHGLNSQKNRMTGQLDDLAETVRKVGEPLRDAPYAALASYADSAAGRLHEVATGLRRRDVRQLAKDLRTVARERPALFVGAGFAAGVMAGRLLKSSPPGTESNVQRKTRREAAGRARPTEPGEHE